MISAYALEWRNIVKLRYRYERLFLLYMLENIQSVLVNFLVLIANQKLSNIN